MTLVLDDGAAFTGDLPSPAMVDDTTSEIVTRSWNSIRALHATRIYPGHGPVRPLAYLYELLT